MEENTNIEQLVNWLEVFTNEATAAVERFLISDTVQDAVTISTELGAALSGAIKGLNALKAVASIPSKLYLRKFEKFCRGLADIPLEKRQRYIETLGKQKFAQESVFILNTINRIEEEDKIPLLIKLLDARCGGDITEKEYRRLNVMVDRTLYSDLVYLGHSITADPVLLRTDSDYGLVASGLLITTGSTWGTVENVENDTGIRFNYTLSAKKLAKICFNVHCDVTPTNIGVTTEELLGVEN